MTRYLEKDGVLGSDPEASMTELFEVIRAIREDDNVDTTVIDKMLEGQSIAQSIGLSADDLEAIYAIGFNCLTSGQYEKAMDVFLHLSLLDPLEAKYSYCMGMVSKLRRDFETAAEFFVQFLARDATSPDGYLRLGECLEAMGDLADAHESYFMARGLAQDAASDPAQLQAQAALDRVTALTGEPT